MASPPPISNHGLQVYLRVRPLISDEDGHEELEYECDPAGSKIRVKIPTQSDGDAPITANPAFSSAPPLRQRQRDNWKTYEGFTGILQGKISNEDVYETSVRPLLPLIVEQQQSACIFTYGHTGSGKTHTLLGYHQEEGVYKSAVRDLFEKLQGHPKHKTEDLCVWVQATELYRDEILDLMTGDSCSLRQDKKRMTHVRGPMMEDDEGRIIQRRLGQVCSTAEEVFECIDAAVMTRKTGKSTHHNKSSRSHLILQLEVVTLALMNERQVVVEHDAQATRLKWLQTERMRGKAKAGSIPKWCDEYSGPTAASKLRSDIREAEQELKKSKGRLAKLEVDLGGTLVFCDLAGNEYAQDAAGSTSTELEEAASINLSLLAVKAMLQSLSKKAKVAVSHRGSNLTRILHRHLGQRAVLLAHMSPSRQYVRKTCNTLQYSARMIPVKRSAPKAERRTK